MIKAIILTREKQVKKHQFFTAIQIKKICSFVLSKHAAQLTPQAAARRLIGPTSRDPTVYPLMNEHLYSIIVKQIV